MLNVIIGRPIKHVVKTFSMLVQQNCKGINQIINSDTKID